MKPFLLLWRNFSKPQLKKLRFDLKKVISLYKSRTLIQEFIDFMKNPDFDRFNKWTDKNNSTQRAWKKITKEWQNQVEKITQLEKTIQQLKVTIRELQENTEKEDK